MAPIPVAGVRPVSFGTLVVDGLSIAYREAGRAGNPKLVLLHGFPASSHQYRDLVTALADRFHVIAPDYPGFGLSDRPDPATWPYTFDHLAEVIERFLALKGFDHYGLYVQDYGGPVGFRIVSRRPEALEWLIIQNSNAYEVGFTAAWHGLRGAPAADRNRPADLGDAARLEAARPGCPPAWRDPGTAPAGDTRAADGTPASDLPSGNSRRGADRRAGRSLRQHSRRDLQDRPRRAGQASSRPGASGARGGTPMTGNPLERLLGRPDRDPGCDAAFEEFDRYCDAVRRGEDAARAFPDFVTHLSNCSACREDAEGLLAFLEQLDSDSPEAR